MPIITYTNMVSDIPRSIELTQYPDSILRIAFIKHPSNMTMDDTNKRILYKYLDIPITIPEETNWRSEDA